MSKDTIIKILTTIIALMVFIWLWHIISRMTASLTTTKTYSNKKALRRTDLLRRAFV